MLKAISVNDTNNLTIDELLRLAEECEKRAAMYRREAAKPTTHPSDVIDFKEAANEADGEAIHLRRIAGRGKYA